MYIVRLIGGRDKQVSYRVNIVILPLHKIFNKKTTYIFSKLLTVNSSLLNYYTIYYTITTLFTPPHTGLLASILPPSRLVKSVKNKGKIKSYPHSENNKKTF